jgi:hypothetical protein
MPAQKTNITLQRPAKLLVAGGISAYGLYIMFRFLYMMYFLYYQHDGTPMAVSYSTGMGHPLVVGLALFISGFIGLIAAITEFSPVQRMGEPAFFTKAVRTMQYASAATLFVFAVYLGALTLEGAVLMIISAAWTASLLLGSKARRDVLGCGEGHSE